MLTISHIFTPILYKIALPKEKAYATFVREMEGIFWAWAALFLVLAFESEVVKQVRTQLPILDFGSYAAESSTSYRVVDYKQGPF